LLFLGIAHAACFMLAYAGVHALHPLSDLFFATGRGLTGLLLLGVLFVMWLFALAFVRRSKHFELFYFSHLLYLVWLGLAIAHAPSFLFWSAVPLFGFALEQASGGEVLSQRAHRTAGLAAALVAFVGSLVGCKTPAPAAEQAPSARCANCHLSEYQSTTHPPHPGVRPLTCAVCHNESSWHPSRLVHSFPLEGAHAKADCFACHHKPEPVFEGTTQLCSVCHAKERQQADQKVPRHASFASDCRTCHDTVNWKNTLAHQRLEASSPDEHAPNPAAP